MSYEVTPPPEMPELQPKKKRPNAIIIGAAVVAIAGIATAGLLISNSKHDDTKAAKPTPAAAKTSATPSMAEQLRDWSDNGGHDTLTTLGEDLTKVGDDIDSDDLDGLSDSCSTLTADLESAQQEDPVPDPTTNKRWKLALEHLANSATACATGAVSGDQTQFDLMASEMDIGIKHMDAVTKRLDEIAGT